MTELEKFEEFMKNYMDMVYAPPCGCGQRSVLRRGPTVSSGPTEASAAWSKSDWGGWLKTVTTNLCLII